MHRFVFGNSYTDTTMTTTDTVRTTREYGLLLYEKSELQR